MRRGMHHRWIEEAEARQVLELAILQRTVSDPYINIVPALPGESWQVRLRSLVSRATTPNFGRPSGSGNGWRRPPILWYSIRRRR